MSSTEAGASTLLRWRPAVLGLTLLLGVLGIYHVRQADEEREGAHAGLHRSNAIRRRSPRLRHARPSIAQSQQTQENGAAVRPADSTTDQAVDRRESFAGTLQLPDDETTVNAGDPNDGQSLLNMLYHIAVEQDNRKAYIHRGVTCNACNVHPIVGIRYRCANCSDYDLCEQCEGLANIHDRTHVFYKVRIPAPFIGANPQQQQPVWYPGKPHVNPRSVPNGLKKQLSDLTGFDRSLIDALWDQFKTLAGCDWPDDPNGLYVGIDREIWAMYCVSPLSKRHTASMALLFDRSFTFWDDNGDGVIGFEEFLQGLTLRQSRNKKEWNRRTFRAHDLDGDGYVTREDFMALFVAHYAYCKEQSRDMARFVEDEVLEGGHLKETLQSTQAVSSCFHGSIPSPDSPRIGEGKTVNNLGDMVITDNGGLLRKEENGLIYGDEHDLNHEFERESSGGQTAMADIFESLAQSMPDWPPDFVTPEDAYKALGRRLSLVDITEPAEQRRVLDVANQRLHPAHDPAHGPAHGPPRLQEKPLTLRQLQPVQANEGTFDQFDGLYDMVMHSPDGDRARAAFAVEPAVTRELLYQKSAEGLHELLDPMFKQLEDLCVFHSRTEKERSRLREQLEAYKSAFGNISLCQKWLDRTLESWRLGDTRKAWLDGDALVEDMISRLMKETEFASNEWMLDAKERIRSGFTSEEHESKIIEKLRTMPGEENQAKARELQRLATAVRRGNNPTPEELDQMLTDTLLTDQAKNLMSPKSNVEDPGNPNVDADITDDLLLEEPGVITIDENTISTLLNGHAIDELHAGREAFDSGTDFVADLRSRTVDQLLADAGYEISDNTPRQSSAYESLSGSDGVVIGPESLSDLEELFVRQHDPHGFDPTLPHHRPNTASEREVSQEPSYPRPYRTWSSAQLKGTMASMEEHPAYEDQEDAYFGVKLKFLTILDMCAENAAHRGGWARISAHEFDQIINGSKGPNLAPIGEWLNLANF